MAQSGFRVAPEDPFSHLAFKFSRFIAKYHYGYDDIDVFLMNWKRIYPVIRSLKTQIVMFDSILDL